MSTIVRTRIIKIGASQGIRIPKAVLEKLGLSAEVELEVQEGQLVIRSAPHPRQNWDEQFQKMAEQGDDKLLDPEVITMTQWDEDEWE